MSRAASPAPEPPDAAPPVLGRARLLAAVVLLEFASGAPYGVVQDLVPVWLLVHHVDLAAIGALNLVGLPWTFKALWAPYVDRLGTFAGWMALGLVGAAAGTLGLAFTGPDLALVVPLLVAIAVFSATQDVAIDGWLVSAVPPGEQGRATGFRVAAYRAAMALAGGGSVVIGDQFGWRWAFVVAAVAMLAILPLQARLPPVPRPAPTPVADWFAALRGWFLQREALALFAFALLYKLGDSAMAPMTKPFLYQAGLSASEVGLLTTTLGAVLVAAGAVLGGDIVSRLGLPVAVVLLGALQALSNVVYGAAALLGGRIPGYTAAILESFTTGLGTAALLALLMRASTGGQAATRFAVLTAIVGLTRTLSGVFSGVAVERIGFAPWFALTFLMALPALALAPIVARPLAGRDPR